MYIKEIELENFFGFKDYFKFDLNKRSNMIYGDDSGDSQLIFAIRYLYCEFHSPKILSIKEKEAYIKAVFIDNDKTFTVKKTTNAETSRFFIDDKEVSFDEIKKLNIKRIYSDNEVINHFSKAFSCNIKNYEITDFDNLKLTFEELYEKFTAKKGRLKKTPLGVEFDLDHDFKILSVDEKVIAILTLELALAKVLNNFCLIDGLLDYLDSETSSRVAKALKTLDTQTIFTSLRPLACDNAIGLASEPI